MTEVTLTIVIALLCGLLGWTDYNNRKERKSLLNALKSKDAADLVNLEIADKTQVKIEKPKEPDLVPVENISDEEFYKTVEDQVNG